MLGRSDPPLEAQLGGALEGGKREAHEACVLEHSENLSPLPVKAVRRYLDVQGPPGVGLTVEAVSLLATEGPSRAVCNAF